MAQVGSATADPSDTCTSFFYNSSANCWRPTSCRECLYTNGCLVNQHGMCANVASLPNRTELEYTRAITQGLVLPEAKGDPRINATQQWVFEAGQVSYCADNDAVCSKCLAERFWSPLGDKPSNERDSRFCVGANGCVCISNCEDTDHTCDKLYELKKRQTSAGSSGEGQLLPPTDDDCRYSALFGDYCRTFRPCHECVTKKGCRVSEYGYCEKDPVNITTGDGYKPELDFRLAFEKNLTLPDAHDRNASEPAERQYWVFPAFEVQYCPTNDTICQRCTQEKFWVNYTDTADSRFCVGADGCVCIANCARADDESTCPWRTTDRPQLQPSEYRGFVVGGVSISAVAVVALVVSWLYKLRTKAILQRDTPPTSTGLAPEASAPPTSPGAGVTTEYGFYSDGTSPSTRPPASAPPTHGHQDALASAPALDPQPLLPRPSQPAPSTRLVGTSEASRPGPTGQLELYGWISHRQHLIDTETRRLNGADDFVLPRNYL